MSDDASKDLSSLGMDLALSFQPDWARGKSSDKPPVAKEYSHSDGPKRPRERTRDNRPRREGNRDNRSERSRRSRDRGQRHGRDRDRSGSPAEEREVVTLPNWKLGFLPRPIGMDGLARQVRASAKVYSLFDLARLVLEDPRRYTIKLEPEAGAMMYRVEGEETPWLTRQEAVRAALKARFDEFYVREVEAGEAPKGNFPCVAEVEGNLIGPPNHHEFQHKLKELHAERFGHLAFEKFRQRVSMNRDPEAIERWKTEAAQSVIYLEKTEEGEPKRFTSRVEVERDFLTRKAANFLQKVTTGFELAGELAVKAPCREIREAVRSAHAALVRFPLPMAQQVSKALGERGLHIFKSHQKHLCVSLVRPRPFDGDRSALSDGLKQIFDYLSDHAKRPRQQQWKDLVKMRPDTPGRETAVASDLSWLIREGHLLDFANGSLQLARRSASAGKDKSSPRVPPPQPEKSEGA